MDEATSWASRLVSAHARGEVTGGELWDLLLDHADDPRADVLVDRVLARFRRVLAGPVPVDPPEATAPDDEVLVVGDDEPGLLAG